MSIRLHIILLTLIAVLAAGFALAREYQRTEQGAAAIEEARRVIYSAIALADLVHALQKERGLTAGLLIDRNGEARHAVDWQRNEGDRTLATISTEVVAMGQALRRDLSLLRSAIDTHGIGDSEVETRYSALIRTLLDRIAADQRAVLVVEPAPLPIDGLAVARESLGLIRATLNRIYTRGSAKAAEIVTVARHYGAFRESLRTASRDIGAEVWREVAEDLRDTVFDIVTRRIETVISGGSGEVSRVAPPLNWHELTHVIDRLKAAEERLYQLKLKALEGAAQEANTTLTRFAITAGVLTLLLSLIAYFALERIFHALSNLLCTLKTVEQEQSLGERVVVRRNDEFGRIGHSVNRLLDRIETEIREKEMLAATDQLTGLRNRRSFLELAAREQERAERYGTPLSLLMADLDHFKGINDSHGHALGDEVLKRFAALMNEQVRATDIPARWGGEEFVILAPESDAGGALKLAEKLRQAVTALDIPPTDRLTCSIGVATRRRSEAFDTLCKRADEALYAAKEAGRDRVQLAAGD